MKLCIAQMDISWENKPKNLAKCTGAVIEAAQNSADLIVFPELTLTGFSMNRQIAEPPGGDTVQSFAALSEKYGIAIAFGVACRIGEVITNRLCIASGGSIIAEYDKIHPFTYGGETSVYTAGNSLAAVSLCGVSVGLTICYDLRFPELYMELSRNCQLIINIANWPDGRRVHWQSLLQSRSIECQSYIAGCNRCGSGNGLDYSGDSAVYSPTGERTAAAEPYREQLIYAEVLPAVCEGARASFPVKNDRRYDLYRDFYVDVD